MNWEITQNYYLNYWSHGSTSMKIQRCNFDYLKITYMAKSKEQTWIALLN
jgi:hypothetical protein